MKYKLLFRLLFTLPLLIPIETVAQGVYVSNQPFHDTAIVRPFGEENFMLTYMDSAFYLYQTGINTAEYFHVPFIVNDMEIWEDSVVFFCGGKGNRGIIGRFNIHDVFSGSGAVDYAGINSSPSYPYVGSLDVVDLMRLTLFLGTAPNTVVMAMVCRERLDAYPNEIRTGVMGTFFDPSGWWPTSVLYNKDGDRKYHDIETLEDMVVATMTDTNNLGCYVRPFDKTNYQFPGAPFMLYGGDEISLMTPMGPSQITQMAGNSAAIVQCDQRNGLLIHFLEFNSATGQASAVFPSTIISSGTGYQNGGCWFNGIRFKRPDKSLFVLGKKNGVGNNVADKWMIEMSGVDTATNILVHWLTSSKPYSMDLGHYFQRPVVSGLSRASGLLNWDIYVPQQDYGCQQLYDESIHRQLPYIQSAPERGGTVMAFQKNIRLFPEINRIEVNSECSYQQP
jgi:hypothetical protein